MGKENERAKNPTEYRSYMDNIGSWYVYCRCLYRFFASNIYFDANFLKMVFRRSKFVY